MSCFSFYVTKERCWSVNNVWMCFERKQKFSRYLSAFSIKNCEDLSNLFDNMCSRTHDQPPPSAQKRGIIGVNVSKRVEHKEKMFSDLICDWHFAFYAAQRGGLFVLKIGLIRFPVLVMWKETF